MTASVAAVMAAGLCVLLASPMLLAAALLLWRHSPRTGSIAADQWHATDGVPAATYIGVAGKRNT